MPTTTINLPLYRVLRALQVSEPDAEAAAAAAPPDLSHLATKDELRAEIAGVRADLKAEIASVRTDIAQTAQRQTTWLVTIVIAAAGVVIAAQRLIPPALPTDAVRAIVEQTMRNFPSQPQPAPGPAILPPRGSPQP